MLNLSLVRLLEVVGEAAGRVSGETQARLEDIPWHEIISLRNRLIRRGGWGMKVDERVKSLGITFAVIAVLTTLISYFIYGKAPLWYEDDYVGRVVEAETGRPLEGVVVLGVWHWEYPQPGGVSEVFWDARETVTDAEGRFVMRGRGVTFFPMAPVRLHIFKAGHEYDTFQGYDSFYKEKWAMLKRDEYYRKRVSWEGDMPVLNLRKLSMEERKARRVGAIIDAPGDEQQIFISELNKERISIGVKPY
jgi:hypothetical protein